MADIDLFGLHGTHVVITGASGGIGLATVKLFGKLGARISAHGNTKTELLESISKSPCSMNIIRADATSEEDVALFYKQACERFGPPEVLVGSTVS
jgi:NAD(P)-dependent dehydrogenase (short-subunit alcohol dehydrogenase family)